jgi:hypothetical protein
MLRLDASDEVDLNKWVKCPTTKELPFSQKDLCGFIVLLVVGKSENFAL